MNLKTASLTPDILHIVKNQGTEHPFTGRYNDNNQSGTYLCRQCGLALFRSQTQFHSGCGWPSFDEEIPQAVLKRPDRDGHRTEIVCARCQGHLGHVFEGEQFTHKNTRHCVNSLSLDFVTSNTVKDTEEAIFAGGCFWGIEYYLKKVPGVLKTEVGYTGGQKLNPTYEEVCHGNTHHLEAIRVLFNPQEVHYEALVHYFFEIHDPTQTNGQGPDIGEQYQSAIFYFDEEQKQTAIHLIQKLETKGLKIATQVLPVAPFWPAEGYHQDYYQRTGKMPYCHHYTKRF